ncbi:MAG: hypothetical protein ACI4F7_04135 [Acutalibacteraceae bacterium]
MKAVRVTAIILAAAILAVLSGCRKLSPSDTIMYTADGNLHYNGRAYVNSGSKYYADTDSEDCVKIAVRPYGFFYLLGAVTVYYGNDAENPEYISPSRGHDLYVREDFKIDFDSLLTIQDTEEVYSFRISDIVTAESLDLESYDRSANSFEEVCDFDAWIEPDNFAYMWITVLEKDGSYYLQDSNLSDLYLLKDGFETELERLGLIGRTERLITP